ncbi:replication factor C small subunit [Candidatus Micrarchaeota archaeon]|nr:replication factor C small subunit [Candidatus Micrarchaeota archaeon]MBI5177455.1 replication factor C small subunit [Candidatus Micrarchaeota archaeon]
MWEKMAGEKNSEFVPWLEKYRPKTLKEVVGHSQIVERMEAYVKSKNLPHLLLAGPPGVGKTTCVLAMARELYGSAMNECFLELNASDERGIDVVRGKIKDFARTIPMSDVDFKLILLDEADALTDDAQQALRRTMEKYSTNTRFLLSCNYSSRIIEPIQSRCAVFRFRMLEGKDIEEIAAHIAKGEGIDLDQKATDAIVYVSGGDARRAVNVLQGASALSPHVKEDDVLALSARARPVEIEQLVGTAMEGKFVEARKILDDLMLKYGMAGEDVMGQIYRSVMANSEIGQRPKAALIERIGEYDFRMSQGADPRIQLEALLAQMALAGKK